MQICISVWPKKKKSMQIYSFDCSDTMDMNHDCFLPIYSIYLFHHYFHNPCSKTTSSV